MERIGLCGLKFRLTCHPSSNGWIGLRQLNCLTYCFIKSIFSYRLIHPALAVRQVFQGGRGGFVNLPVKGLNYKVLTGAVIRITICRKTQWAKYRKFPCLPSQEQSHSREPCCIFSDVFWQTILFSSKRTVPCVFLNATQYTWRPWQILDREKPAVVAQSVLFWMPGVYIEVIMTCFSLWIIWIRISKICFYHI